MCFCSYYCFLGQQCVGSVKGQANTNMQGPGLLHWPSWIIWISRHADSNTTSPTVARAGRDCPKRDDTIYTDLLRFFSSGVAFVSPKSQRFGGLDDGCSLERNFYVSYPRKCISERSKTLTPTKNFKSPNRS